MIPVIDYTEDGIPFIANSSALRELEANNCTMPDIDRIIFNLGKKAYPVRNADGKVQKDEAGKPVLGDEVPVLATTVFFIDGTKVTVVNSANDPVDTEEAVLSNGSKVLAATPESKERGIIYAVIKRMLSHESYDGKMEDSGISRILSDLVKSGHDSNIAKAEAKIQKANAKAKYEEMLKNPKPKKVRYSVNDTLARINKLLDKAEAGDKAAEAAVKEIAL